MLEINDALLKCILKTYKGKRKKQISKLEILRNANKVHF